jgi:hypothetical protein
MVVDVDQGVGRFVRNWFDLLSRHAPVAQVLPLVIDNGLEMVFPERTLRGHDDFVHWYAGVGASYTDQDHVVEDMRSVGNGDSVDVDLTVVWRAEKAADGSRLAFRVDQSWRLTRPAPTAAPMIASYRVGTMHPL